MAIIIVYIHVLSVGQRKRDKMFDGLFNFLRISKWELFFIIVIALLGLGTAATFLIEAGTWLWQYIHITWR